MTAVFSEAMNSATINASSFTLEDSSATPVVGNVSYNGVTATLTPSSLLGFSETYTVRISTDVEDVSGNALVSDQSWSFTAVAGIQISWNANPETAVNRAEGGYRVYYSTTSGFNPGDVGVTVVDVPYSTGTTAPTSVLIPLSSGTYYIRVAAYSALNAPGTSGGSISTATPQISLVAP